MHAEDDDLVFDAERREQRRDVAGVAVAQHVAQPRVVAGAQHRRELFGRPRLFPNRGDGLVALRTGELLFHLFQRCSDDVVVMHVRADGLDGVEPQPVNQIEIAGREGRRMRAEVVGVGAAAAVIDDEPDVERFGLVGALPGVAEQARLILGRQRRRLADVHVRRAQAHRPCRRWRRRRCASGRSAAAPDGRPARPARRRPTAAAARTASAWSGRRSPR